MKNIKKYINNERGSQAIEFLAMFPLIILAILIIWQICLIAFSLVVAESAARDGARAAAIHDSNWKQVAIKSASGLKVNVTGGPGSEEAHVFIEVEAPIVKLPLISEIEFSYTVDAVMPMEEESDGD
ncbi:TadE/TadG family type IV pilus assembly protein [Bacillus sp. 31A1R]|uniref:TadE/TadG family type IV pilus assembly protein n=1 Tax=Robertmurraya mangrovi TaxID=3098077 RepID=A0ABU5J4S7_9BACI|nr:TadE/TadG family type IV pilus assembly protein [Bacillus sp. 31A1R]MDZ5474424.1 TadE/TadG family type IV pilus assembly protein [Bacillus sp. 31A1R]